MDLSLRTFSLFHYSSVLTIHLMNRHYCTCHCFYSHFCIGMLHWISANGDFTLCLCRVADFTSHWSNTCRLVCIQRKQTFSSNIKQILDKCEYHSASRFAKYVFLLWTFDIKEASGVSRQLFRDLWCSYNGCIIKFHANICHYDLGIDHFSFGIHYCESDPHAIHLQV